MNQERVTALRTYLNSMVTEDDTTDNGGAVPNDSQYASVRIQVLYGLELPHGRIDWKREPMHPDKPAQELIDQEAGYVVRKTTNGVDSPWQVHSIIVRSPHIMKVLRDVLADYPGISPEVDSLTLSSPFEPIFHRWTDLCQAIDASDQLTKDHIKGFAELLEDELGIFFQVLRDADMHGIIDHKNLWTVFVPNELVWWDNKQHHSIGRVLQTITHKMTGDFIVSCQQTVWDGFQLKAKTESLKIPAFSGTCPIAKLNIVPLSRQPDADQIKAIVLNRGRKFLGLLGCHYREYLGFGMKKARHGGPPGWEAGGPPEWEAVGTKPGQLNDTALICSLSGFRKSRPRRCYVAWQSR